MSEGSKPKIKSLQIYHDEFLFLGIENIIEGPIENADMGAIWGNFFKAGGFDKIDPYSMETYKSMVVYHKNDSEHLIYFIGAIVEGIDKVPEGYKLVKFPACDFLVVTHEWLPTKDEAIGQISSVNSYQEKVQIPNGYIRYDGADSQIVLIERENMNTENGSRYEFWVPIKKLSE
jgi:predicted transcriptional regulator YdeE